MRVLLAVVVGVFGVLAGHGPVVADEDAPVVQISHVTGKPVPRFETLRYAAVNGRTGPSEDHSIAWRYERQGLPVLILKESRNWAWIRDPDGDEVWMHQRTLQGGDTALVHERTELREAGNIAARAIAEVEAGVLLQTNGCVERFCAVEIDGTSGWILASDLWGVGLDHTTD